MTLPIPVIDDKTFSQLVDEAKKLIPQYNKEWTNYNTSDPGIMLVELFAWLTESVLYKMDQTTDEQYDTFLRLLGVDREELGLETIEEGIAYAIEQNSELRLITNRDTESIVLDVLADKGLTGKVYPLNNTDLSKFDIDPETAKDSHEGYVTIIVVPSYREDTTVTLTNKSIVQSSKDIIWKALDSKGRIDEYYSYDVENDDYEFAEIIELTHESLWNCDAYGFDFSIFEDNVIVGAPLKPKVDTEEASNVYCVDAGVAYIYNLNDDGYSCFKINAKTPEQYKYFGKSVFMGDRYAIIGAPGKEGKQQGSAHIFGQDLSGQWIEKQQLDVDNKNDISYAISEEFACSVCINNNFAVVGAKGAANSNGIKSGAIYVYQRHINGSWTQIQKIFPADGSDGDKFGSKVSMTDNYIIVSAPESNNSGCLYIYKSDKINDLWVEDDFTKITMPDNIENAYFGSSLSCEDDYIIVGTKVIEKPAYIYQLQNITTGDVISEVWSHVTTIQLPDGEISPDSIPFSVSISNYNAVLSVQTSESSKVYIYQGDVDNEWEHVKTESIEYDDYLENRPVAIHNRNLLAGLTYYNVNESVHGISDIRVRLNVLPVRSCIDDYIPSSELLDVIFDQLNEKRILTNKISIRGPIFKRLKLEIKIKGISSFKKSAVEDNIRFNLFKFYDPVTGGPDSDGYPIGRTVYNSEFIKEIENSDGVDYLEQYRLWVFNNLTQEYDELSGSLIVESYEIIQFDPNNIIVNFS